MQFRNFNWDFFRCFCPTSLKICPKKHFTHKILKMKKNWKFLMTSSFFSQKRNFAKKCWRHQNFHFFAFLDSLYKYATLGKIWAELNKNTRRYGNFKFCDVIKSHKLIKKSTDSEINDVTNFKIAISPCVLIHIKVSELYKLA